MTIVRRPLFVLLLLFVSFPAFATVALVKVGTSYDEARNGFSSICFEEKKEFTLSEDLSNQTQVADEIKAGNFAVIVALGQQAALFAKANFGNLPIVYCLVVTPDKIGLKADNITGVSLDVPLLEQFTIFKNLSKKIKRVGAIYTQPANDALIAIAKGIASDQGLSLVPAPIASSQDIQKAMTDLVGKVDALWIPPDTSLNSDDVIKYIGSTSLSKLIPCIGPNERFVRAGAVLSLAADSIEAGKSAGDLVNKIVAGTPPSKLPVVEQKRPKIIINLRAAGLLGLTIPKNVQDAASKVYQ